MTIDIAQARLDTPACESCVYLNNASAALMPDQVHQEIQVYITQEHQLGSMQAAYAAQAKLNAFYAATARLLQAAPDEIAFIDSSTRGWQILLLALDLQPGDRVLTHQAEYSANVMALLKLRQTRGVEIDCVPYDEAGGIDMAAMQAAITPNTRVLAITHVPSQRGLVSPVKQLGELAKAHQLVYMLDVCQSVGQLSIDVKEIGCDVAVGSGRKFLRGPRGTGFLYVRQALLEQLTPPFIDLASADWLTRDSFQWQASARRFELFERHCAGQVGLAIAIEYALQTGIPAIQQRIERLSEYVQQCLGQLTGVVVQDALDNSSAIVTLRVSGDKGSQSIVDQLSRQGIRVHHIPQMNSRLDLGARRCADVIRVSPHYYNTEQEIEQLCLQLDACI